MQKDDLIQTLPPSPTERLLASHGILPTAQRLQVGDVLFEKAQHLSADQVREKLGEAGYSVSKATVYNTLRLFADHGLLREVFVDPAKVFYDTNTHPHHHFYDVDTAELTDIPFDEVLVEELPKPPPGCELQSVEVVVRVRKK